MNSRYCAIENEITIYKQFEKLCQVLCRSVHTSPKYFIVSFSTSSQRRQEARLILFYKIINGLAQVPFEGVLVETYKGTRRKHNMKFRQIGHTTSQYGQSFFPKTISAWNGLAFAEAPSLAVFRSNFIIKISVHPFRIIP